jgi:hypothetical protein
VLLSDTLHRGGGQIQRLVPADPFPPGIGSSLGTGSSERVRQPLRVIDQLRPGASFVLGYSVRRAVPSIVLVVGSSANAPKPCRR